MTLYNSWDDLLRWAHDITNWWIWTVVAKFVDGNLEEHERWRLRAWPSRIFLGSKEWLHSKVTLAALACPHKNTTSILAFSWSEHSEPTFWIPICTDHPQYVGYNPVITPKLIINQWLSRSHLYSIYSAPELRKQANEKEGRRKDAHLDFGDISMGQNEVLDFSTWDVWKSINSDEHQIYRYYTHILCTHVQILHN